MMKTGFEVLALLVRHVEMTERRRRIETQAVHFPSQVAQNEITFV
jgi:hypothetical protein